MAQLWPASDSGWKARVRGALSLSACAASLAVQIRDSRAGKAAWEEVLASPPYPLRRTADTSLMLALADHVVRHGGLVERDGLVADFAAEWRRDPGRGYSPAVVNLLRRVSDGSGWLSALRAIQATQPGIAAGWVLPVGLLPGLRLGATAARARHAAGAVDEHPLTLDGAAVYAVAISVAAHTSRQRPPQPDSLVRSLRRHTHTAVFAAALEQVCALVRQHAPAERAAEALGVDSGALCAVPMALTAFLLHPDQPQQAVRFTLAALPDAMAAAAMAASLCGAWAGETCLPVTWGVHLESATRLWTVATALAALHRAHRHAGASGHVTR